MKENLIVVDFDKTLIPFDSFKRFIYLWMKEYPVSIFLIVTLQKIRILNAGNFKRLIIQRVTKNRNFTYINNDFSNALFERINIDVQKKIKNELKQNTTVLLLSASPDIYVSNIGNKLGYKAKGSFFDLDQRFVHLFGSLKIEYLKKHYPRERFNYLYAISDSNSDIELLNMFIKSDLLNK